MDMMQIRKMIMAQMTGGGSMANAQWTGGSFTGDGTKEVGIQIGFEPDVLVIDCGLDYATAGWIGIGNIAFVKNQFVYDSIHTTATGTSASSYLNFNVGGTYGAYGGDDLTTTGAYRSAGTYSNGVLTVTNKSNNDSVKFINNQTYSWTAYKKN